MNSVIIFVKAPVPGQVKTRLCPPLSHARAAALYRAFARDTLALARKAAPPLQLEIAYAAEESYPDIRWLTTRRATKYFIQKGNDLGERLIQAFDRGFLSGSRKVVVIGSDTPHLKPSEINRAFKALDRNDAVIGPAQDGGYYLIGLRRMNERLFSDVPWSSSEVLKTTLSRAAEQKMSVKLLALYADVDTPQDLSRLAQATAISSRRSLSETRRLLRSLPHASLPA